MAQRPAPDDTDVSLTWPQGTGGRASDEQRPEVDLGWRPEGAREVAAPAPVARRGVRLRVGESPSMAALRAELAALRGEVEALRGELADLRTELAAGRTAS